MVERVIIGEAELWHGDCLEVMPGLGVFDFVMTDPPYGHNQNDNDLASIREKVLGLRESAKKAEARPILNDGQEANDLYVSSLEEIKEHLSDGAVVCCCCGGGGPEPQFARWVLDMDRILAFKQAVVWDKGPIGMGWHYRRSYEVILVGHKKGATIKWYDKTQKIENIIRPGGAIKKIIPLKEDHPTPKPPQLAQHFAKLHTQEGDVVFDPFMGAGWVGVGVLPMGRKFIGIELDRQWFDLACERIDATQRQQSFGF